MVFSSSVFLYAFLPLFLAVYYLSPRGVKSFSIALGSYVFYGWWRPDFVLLMLEQGTGRKPGAEIWNPPS